MPTSEFDFTEGDEGYYEKDGGDVLLADMMHWPAFDEWKRSKRELQFLENILRYAAIV